MPENRFFLDTPLQEHATLTGSEARHALTVMRCQVDDCIELVNGRGILARGIIERIGKKELSIKISSRTVAPEDPPVILMQALPKLAKLDLIAEKGTELGMTELILFPGERSEKKELKEHQKERLTSLMIAAMKQCGRLHLPKLKVISPIKQWAMLPEKSVFGDLNAPHTTLNAQCFINGPESGLSKHEVEHLEQLGSRGVRFHKNTLRTETAALIAITLIQN